MSEIQEWHRELALRVADMAYLIYDRGEAEEDEDARLIADEFDKRLAAEWEQTVAQYDSPLRVIVGDELIIKVGVNRLDGHDYHASIPALTFSDKQQWAEDVAYELQREDETGASPLTDLIDACMNAALEDGSIGVSEDSMTHIGTCETCHEDQVPLRHTKAGQQCKGCSKHAAHKQRRSEG